LHVCHFCEKGEFIKENVQGTKFEFEGHRRKREGITTIGFVNNTVNFLIIIKLTFFIFRMEVGEEPTVKTAAHQHTFSKSSVMVTEID
jgi:hypothetical protein